MKNDDDDDDTGLKKRIHQLTHVADRKNVLTSFPVKYAEFEGYLLINVLVAVG